MYIKSHVYVYKLHINYICTYMHMCTHTTYVLISFYKLKTTVSPASHMPSSFCFVSIAVLVYLLTNELSLPNIN